MIGSGLRGGDACEVRGVFRSSILAAVGCPIGREEQAARVCRWDASMQGMLVYTLQGHFCRDAVTSGEGREQGNSCTSKQCKITMGGKGRDSRDRAEQGYQQQPVHAISNQEPYWQILGSSACRRAIALVSNGAWGY